MSKYKKLIARLLVAIFIFTNVLICISPVYAAPKDKVKKKKNKVEVIVKYKNEQKAQETNANIKNKLKLKKMEKKRKMKTIPVEVYEISENDDINTVVQQLMADPNVEYAQPNYELYTSNTGNIVITDPRFGDQWALSNTGQMMDMKNGTPGMDINIMNAWTVTEGSKSIVVAVLDTGIDINHIDLKDNIFVNSSEIPGNGIDDDGNGYVDDVSGWDFANGDNNVFDSAAQDKHGTHVAGIIAASANTAGIKGIAPKVKILPLKFISGNVGYTSDVLEAIDYAKQMGIKIVNCSFGGTNSNPALKDAMTAADMLFVCAAGNNGMNTASNPIYPACYDLPNIVSVAAMDNTGSIAVFSNYGANIHMAAPGVSILSTVPDNGFEYMNGTSMAAPQASGVAALVQSHMSNLTAVELAERLRNSTKELDKLQGKVAKSGMLDAKLALTVLADNGDNTQIDSSKSNTQLIVKLKDASKSEELRTAIIEKLELIRLDVAGKLLSGKLEVWEIDARDSINAIVSELMVNTAVEYAQPNYELLAYEDSDEPDGKPQLTAEERAAELMKLEAEVIAKIKDIDFVQQWSLNNTGQTIGASAGTADMDINILGAWSVTEGNAGTVVAVLDTGIDINHAELSTAIYRNKNEVPDNGIDDDRNGYIDDINGWDFINNDNTVYDSDLLDEHGTHIAGVIAAQSNEEGIKGIAPKVKLLPLKFMNGSKGYTTDAIRAIEYAKTLGVKLVNCSFGSTSTNFALRDAMAAMDMLFVCAAGNNGQNTALNPVYPASFELPNVISVTAVDNTGKLIGSANYGGRVTIAAPGEDILSTAPGNQYKQFSGTSASAAHVTGVASLVLSAVPHLTAAELANRIKNSAKAAEGLLDRVTTGGMIDAAMAVALVYNEIKDVQNEEEAALYDAIMVSLAAEISPVLKEQIHYGENGVSPSTGNYSTSSTDMSMTAPGFVVNISRTYNSKDDRATSILGRGWTFGFEGSLKTDTTNSTLMVAKLPNGSVQVFVKNADGTYTANDSRSKLQKQSDNTHILTTKDQYTYGFNTSGYLVWMKDRKDNAVNIEVDNTSGKILSITDQVGRKFTVAYNAQNLITSITDPMNRKVSYEYENGLLSKVTDPMGYITQYLYDTEKYLKQIKDNENNIIDTITYNHATGENQHKVTNYTDRLGNTFSYTYNNTERKTTITDSNNRVVIKWYDSWMYIIKSQDPENKQVLVEYYLDGNNVNKYGEEKQITDRYGNVTQYLRDNNGNITKIINPDGSSREYVYDDKNNLTMEKDELGNKVYYVYDETKIYLLKKIQPLNGTDVYNAEADQSKFAITAYTYYTDAEAEQLGYKMKGMLKSETDPMGNVTTYTYDIYGNTKTVTDPMGNEKTNSYNSIGWLTASITPSGYKTEYQYDLNGLLVKQTLNNGETVRIVYDSLGRKVKEVSPNLYKSAEDGLCLIPVQHSYDGDKGSRYTYYANGLLQTAKDSLNYETSYAYDVYGNMTAETKPNGSKYIYEYDVMNRLSKVSFKNNAEDTAETPIVLEEYSYTVQADKKLKKTHIRYLNDTETAVTDYIYDYAGRLVETKYPDNTSTKTVYNSNGTIYSQTLPNGGTTYCKYDGLGKLTESWKQLEGDRYSYARTEYDKAGRAVVYYTGKDKVGLYETPAIDRLIVEKKEYYANGNLKSKYDDFGRRTVFYYDKDNNKVKEEVYTSPEKLLVAEYEYNHLGKVTKSINYVRTGDIYGSDFTDNSTMPLITAYSYDKEGKLTKIVTPGKTVSYKYDSMGRQTEESYISQDENGLPAVVVKKTEYNWSGNVVRSIDPKGNITTYEYDKREQLIKQVKTTKEMTTILDENQNPVEVETAIEHVTAYAYDRAGRRIAEVTPQNYDAAKNSIFEMNRYEYIYDKRDRLKLKSYKGQLTEYVEGGVLTVSTSDMAIKAYKYDISGNVIKEVDGEGYRRAFGMNIDDKISAAYGKEYTYNLQNQLVTVLDAASKDRYLPYSVKYGYDGSGRRNSETDANGVEKRYYYDDAGNLIRTTVKKTAADAEQTLATATYDLAGRKLTDTDALGNTTVYEYNDLNKVSKVILPGDATIPSNTIIYQYDKMGRLAKKQDAMGTTDLYTYDVDGRELVIVQQDADGGDAIKQTRAYDLNGNVRYRTDGNGSTTEYIYDELNRLIETRQEVSNLHDIPVLHKKVNKYDKNGNIIEQTDWRGNKSTNVYDELGRLIEKKDPYTTIQKLAYNHNNAQIKSYDANNNAVSYEYDKNGRQTAITDQEGHTKKESYDNVGNIASKTDGNGNITTFAYDMLNRLITVVNAKYEKTSYTYDLNGNKLTQTDGSGNITIFEYNAAGKLARIINHGGRTDTDNGYLYDFGKVESYVYNADGTVKASKDRNGVTTNYVYDIHKRLLSKTAGGSTIAYTYDANGNKLTIKDSTGTTARVYDQLGRVIMKTVPNIGATTFEYDIIVDMEEGCVGERSTDPKGNITLKVYDKVGRLKSVTSDNQTTTYTYDGNGNRTSVLYHDGSKEEYTYYKNNLLNTLVNTKADATVIDSYSYVYDNANNQIQKTDSKGTTTYTYDSLNRLMKVVEPLSLGGKLTLYSYDKAGNRLTESVIEGSNTTNTTYTYDHLNRLIKTFTKKSASEEETTRYTYDYNGNLLYKEIEKLQPLEDLEIPTFTMIIFGETNTDLGKFAVMFQYDEWNQLIRTTSGSSVSSYRYNGEGYRVEKQTGGKTTRYLYEADKVILEVDEKGTQTAKNVYGLNLISRTVDGEKLYYFYNGHADVTALMDPLGNLKATYYYDAFGNPVEQTGTANNPYRYAGYQYDEETGNYYLNARYYDPKIARFLTEDTYRGKANDPLSLNLYTYCLNNPIKYWDPTGHIVENMDDGNGSNTKGVGSSLSVGDTGENVEVLQQALKDMGYDVDVDGVFGTQTQEAVEEFQKSNNLTADGVAGLNTNKALYGQQEAKEQREFEHAVFKEEQLLAGEKPDKNVDEVICESAGISSVVNDMNKYVKDTDKVESKYPYFPNTSIEKSDDRKYTNKTEYTEKTTIYTNLRESYGTTELNKNDGLIVKGGFQYSYKSIETKGEVIGNNKLNVNVDANVSTLKGEISGGVGAGPELVGGQVTLEGKAASVEFPIEVNILKLNVKVVPEFGVGIGGRARIGVEPRKMKAFAELKIIPVIGGGARIELQIR